jgi:hypothetical protein
MAESRKAIHAFLTPSSHEAWHAYAAEHGVSVSAMIEAMAIDWAERRDGGEQGNGRGAPLTIHTGGGEDDFELPELEVLAREARRIDAQRRRRARH